MTWFLRSMGDRDTHHGVVGPDGAVAAACGARFTPRPLPYDRVSLPGYPQDRDQICPACEHHRRTRRPASATWSPTGVSTRARHQFSTGSRG
ncbi:MAG: hypothetical protein JO268_17410 [Pseudonocardiales bacterium]|nr:hypothetical protein [Pseudonocardiales bacterium]